MLRNGLDLRQHLAQRHHAIGVLGEGQREAAGVEGLIVPAMRCRRTQRLNGVVQGLPGPEIVVQKDVAVGAVNVELWQLHVMLQSPNGSHTAYLTASTACQLDAY